VLIVTDRTDEKFNTLVSFLCCRKTNEIVYKRILWLIMCGLRFTTALQVPVFADER
jgi:hypothetical protein